MQEILGKQGYFAEELPSFMANIKLPTDIDRNKFISYCYNTGTAFVQGVDNQFESNVSVSRDLINRLSFPNESYELGSSVLCITDKVYGTSKIVAVFQDIESTQEVYEENQWRIFKQSGESFVDIDAKANTGEINFIAHSGGYDNVSSNFRFLNTQNLAKLNVEVQGDLNIEVDNEFNLFTQRGFSIKIEDTDINEDMISHIGYKPGEGFNYLDEFENEIKTSEEGVDIKIKNGEEFGITNNGFLLKNSKADLKTILIGVYDALMQSIIQTPAGPGAIDPGTIAKINKAKTDTNNLFK